MIDLDALEQKVRAALAALEGTSPAPWVADIDGLSELGDADAMWTGKFYTGHDRRTWCTYNDEPWSVPNARFCAAARTSVPELADAVLVLASELREVRASLVELRTIHRGAFPHHDLLDAIDRATEFAE